MHRLRALKYADAPEPSATPSWIGRVYSPPMQGVVYGPCPGCDAWQVEATDEALWSYEDSARPMLWVVEEAVREHADECPNLLARAAARR